ncbi:MULTISPECIES: hypothetical protein [unclassified Paenarthrobacter]|uniref:hypothetical protein n=1 Tax=unclassified Paenarthrobacter TaxID=2634190 RepID=UPI00144693C6|nr:hypothetical protein [Arthrobacter sp. M5]NKR14410.1 hypothetical protein [Arthrobacter sp. M6]
MSVPNENHPEQHDMSAPIEFSRDELRAIEHHRKLELGEQDEVFGTVFSQSAHFSYFPLAKVQGTEWVRRNAWGEIAIDAGRIAAPGGSKRTGVPFGGLPRLLMAYITTEARRVNAAGGDPSRLDLTDSLNAMVRELGLTRPC